MPRAEVHDEIVTQARLTGMSSKCRMVHVAGDAEPPAAAACETTDPLQDVEHALSVELVHAANSLMYSGPKCSMIAASSEGHSFIHWSCVSFAKAMRFGMRTSWPCTYMTS